MSASSLAMTTWARLSRIPAGKWAFSRFITLKAPYFASIRPRFEALRPGYCELRIRKRRAVLNHLGSVHAIAMCNMAELAGGMMTDVTIPPGYRWIPKGMTVEYIAKAETNLRAIAELTSMPELGESTELPVSVKVIDTHQTAVFQAVITMWVSRKRPN